MNYNGTAHKAHDEQDYIRRQIQDGELSYDNSYPGGAYWSSDDSCHYNRNGEQLRDISQYDDSEDGYTPFGDE